MQTSNSKEQISKLKHDIKGFIDAIEANSEILINNTSDELSLTILREFKRKSPKIKNKIDQLLVLLSKESE